MTLPPDRDLQHRFHELRDADARRAPSFARVVAGRSERAKRSVLWPALAGSMALVALFALWRLTTPPEPPFELRAGELRVPTDFLTDLVSLPIPGADEIPRIGDIDWFPLELDNRSRQ